MKKILLLLFSLVLCANESYYDRGVLVELKSVDKARALGSSASNSFETSSGVSVSVKNEVLVKCKEGVKCMDLLESYNPLEIKKVTDTIYMLSIASSESVFALSRKLYESGAVLFAHPNFTKKSHKR